MYNISCNPSYNSLEITFDGKPSESIRAALKALRFRWNGARRLWYGYADERAVRAAIDGAMTAAGRRAAGTTADARRQDHIRIYWNGIRIDGGKLIRCGYSLDNNAEHAPSVSVYALDYDSLPRDLMPVTNDSDIYTDYFESDRAYLTPAHPLYRYFRYAALKARARQEQKYCEKLRERLRNERVERWPGYMASMRADIANREKLIAEYTGAADPGQPTADDLAEIDLRRTEAENARRAAEHEAELKARERMLIQRNDGRRMIEQTAAEYPIADGAPVVTINWSEHPAFYDWEDDQLRLSVAAAERILGSLDNQSAKDEGGYYKTKFTITGKDDAGEDIAYQGRYDLGDLEGGLIAHIRNFAEWYRTHDSFGHEIENPAETTQALELVKYLETFTA